MKTGTNHLKVLIIITGSELLNTQSSEANGPFLNKICSELGWEVISRIILPDELTQLQKILQIYINEIDLAFITGGLGGTRDDNTIECIASVINKKIMRDDIAMARLKERLKTRFPRKIAEKKLKNHPGFHFIEGSLRMPNGDGIACGHILGVSKSIIKGAGTKPVQDFEPENEAHRILRHPGTGQELTWSHNSELLICLLPGVPDENRWLVKNELLPLIKIALNQGNIVHLFYEIWGVTESEFETAFFQNYKLPAYIRYGISFKSNRVKVSFTGNIASRLKDEIELRLQQLFGKENICNNLLTELARLLTSNNMFLVTAESCTAGMIASKLTETAGSSEYYIGSFLTYSNELKTSLLSVSPQILEEHGAVSKETVIAMGEGALRRTNADICLSVSGVAGPGGGTPEKPVGTVWTNISYCKKNSTTHFPELIYYPRDRKSVREFTVMHLLNRLRIFLFPGLD
jgi:nicotinamide-nucleotide amidase